MLIPYLELPCINAHFFALLDIISISTSESSLSSPLAKLPNKVIANVDLFIWVVTDVEKVKSGWEKLGFNHFEEHGNLTLQDFKVNGEPAKTEIKMISANLAGAKVLWIQPVSGESAFSDYLKMKSAS